MEVDMELICGTEDYEDLQQYFEHKRNFHILEGQTVSQRLRMEYLPELEDTYEEDKINNRRETVERIWGLLQKISSDIEESSVSETESEGQN